MEIINFRNRNEQVVNLKFFIHEKYPNAIYLKFNKDGKDYCIGMDKDLEKNDITIIDEKINQELLEGAQYLTDIPSTSEELVSLALGEIKYQDNLNEGGDPGYE